MELLAGSVGGRGVITRVRGIVFSVWALALAFGLLFSTTAQAETVWIQTFNSQSRGSITASVLTPDGSDVSSYKYAKRKLTVSAPGTNASGNLREVYWPTESAATEDSRTCATWSSQSASSVQQGAALRISGSRALTVTKNIFGYPGVLNVHAWDVSQQDGTRLLSQKSYPSVLLRNGHVLRLPWHLCAQVVGQTLQYKVWVGSHPEPAWGDPTYGDTVTVPTDFVYAGQTGWYLGHIPPGGEATMTHLATWSGQASSP